MVAVSYPRILWSGDIQDEKRLERQRLPARIIYKAEKIDWAKDKIHSFIGRVQVLSLACPESRGCRGTPRQSNICIVSSMTGEWRMAGAISFGMFLSQIVCQVGYGRRRVLSDYIG